MLEIKPVCEHCGKKLPYDSTEAMICSFECSFCRDCVEDVLENVCPNCGGGFEKRPVRPKAKLDSYPPSAQEYKRAVDMDKFRELQERYRGIDPAKR
jgi:hypothetical protein